MNKFVNTITTVVGRVAIAVIFLMSALGNKIPQFNGVAAYMASEGVPASKIMLAGAIAFLIAGSLSIILGFRARVGATLLLIFLILATYFFHDFWNFEGQQQQDQMIQFMKNLSMMGTMLFLIGNGSGAGSLDSKLAKSQPNATAA